MIVGSVLLILVAIGLLVAGVARGSDPMLWGSVGASALAAVTLVVGVRQMAAARAAAEENTGDAAVPSRRARRYSPPPPARAAAPTRPPVTSREDDDITTVFDRPTFDYHPGFGHPGIDRAPVDHAHLDRPPFDRPPLDPAPYEPSTMDRPGGLYGSAVPMSEAPALDDDDDDDELDDLDPPDEPPVQLTSPVDAGRVARMATEVLVIDGRPRYHLAGCVHLLGRQHEGLPVAEAVELGFSPCSLCEPNSALLAEARRV